MRAMIQYFNYSWLANANRCILRKKIIMIMGISPGSVMTFINSES